MVNNNARTVAYVDRLRKERMNLLIDMAGGQCCKCGYNRCIRALDFHHRDPLIKSFNIDMPNMTKKWSSVLIEFTKCDLLCANCHREHHSQPWQWKNNRENILTLNKLSKIKRSFVEKGLNENQLANKYSLSITLVRAICATF